MIKQAVSEAMQSFIDKDILSCVSYCLIDDGEIVAEDFLGYQSKEQDLPLGEDSIYRIFLQHEDCDLCCPDETMGARRFSIG